MGLTTSVFNKVNILQTLANGFAERGIIREILRHEGCHNDDDFNTCAILDKLKVLPYADHRSVLKFFRGVGEKQPSEVVALHHKAAIRTCVTEMVHEWKFGRGEPYCHLWYYPEKYRTVAAFRVDCDSTDYQSFFKLVSHAGRHCIPLTWFLHTEAQASYLADIRDIKRDGHDIQLHCYRHETYADFRQNLDNIRKGKELMEANGMVPAGYASPFGKWNPDLNRVLEQLKFSYSSEFAMGYDDFPFYPVTGNKTSKILQLPVHPICIGSLRKSYHSPEEMMSYFERVIHQCHQTSRPIMLYGHPYREIDHYGDVIQFIFCILKDLKNTWVTTYSAYASWWKKRLEARYLVRCDANGVTIETKNNDPTLTLRVIRPNGREYFFPLLSGNYSFRDG